MGLRDEMPGVAAFVDAMREAFGRDEVNSWMLGRNGGAFWASENGREWGARPDLGTQAMSLEGYRLLARPVVPIVKDAA